MRSPYLQACLIACLLTGLLAANVAQAELYLDVAGGYTRFLVTAHDGDYLQRGLPHRFDLSSMAYKIGLGYRFNDRWSVQGGYVNFGTLKQDARFVDDPDYSVKMNQCIAKCGQAVPNKITDAYHGGELTVTRAWRLSEDWAAHLKGGGAYLMHRMTVTRYDEGRAHENYGQFLATVIGAGASYQWVYLELDYYHGLGGSNGFMGKDEGWPLAKEFVVVWAGVQVPFTIFSF